MEESKNIQETGRLFKFSIGNTGLWTCALRVRETKKENPLYRDEFAEKFGGKEAEIFLKRVEDSMKTSLSQSTVKRGELFMAIRHRYFDDFLLSQVKEQKSDLKQIVIGAAGLDSRAFRIKWPTHTNLFELDQEEVLNYKEKKIQEFGMVPNCNRIPIGVDLRDLKWIDLLLSKGFRQDLPSAWTFEGLFPYLKEESVREILLNISKLVHKDTWICFDVPSKIDPQTNADLLKHLEDENAPLIFSMKEPESFLKSCGWDPVKITMPGDQGVNYGIKVGNITGWEGYFIIANKKQIEGH